MLRRLLAVLAIVVAIPSADALAQGSARSTLVCQSRGGYTRCVAPDAWNGARLVREIGQSARCIEGQSWGWDRNAVWVDRNCRAQFEAGERVLATGGTITCASAGNGYQRCPAETRRGVRLVRQLSTARCVEGRSWGTANGYVWVDEGCRAEFQVGPAGGWSRPGTGADDRNAQVTCQSTNRQRVECPAPGASRGVRLVRQTSDVACLEGRTWGTDDDAIWVTGGCRAVFEVGDRVANAGERVVCSSASNARTRCRAEIRRGVRLVRQLSEARCVEGQTWGTENGYIWVDRGCRAEFSVGGSGGWVGGTGGVGQGGSQNDDPSGGWSGAATPSDGIVCGANTPGRMTCPTNGRVSRVVVRRELGREGRCVANRTWGHGTDEIWTTGGCRAQFEVTYR